MAWTRRGKWLAPLVAGGLAAAAFGRDDERKAGEVEKTLPTYSWQQVQQHSGGAQPAWIVYKHGVYDVTEFAGGHAGGTRILQAAGKSVELFWKQSEPHSRAGVPETLEELRIGNLRDEDFDKLEAAKTGSKEASSKPLQHYFFIEGVDVDPTAFKLQILGASGEMKLSLDELKTKFQQHHVTTTIQCASPGTVSTRVPAKWTGVLLADVLVSAGVTSPSAAQQVRFEALDTDKQGRAFGSVMETSTALDKEVGVLLAYEMDGAPIPKEHGFPLRVIVPGTTGKRNVKFVHRIIVT